MLTKIDEIEELDDNVVFTADDEEPNCMQCDHMNASTDAFCERCGPSCWWYNYRRTVKRKDLYAHLGDM